MRWIDRFLTVLLLLLVGTGSAAPTLLASTC